MISNNPSLLNFVQEGIEVRRETLEEVMMGRKGLLERRFEILDRRQSTFLEKRERPSTKPPKTQQNENVKGDTDHQGSPKIEPFQNVEIPSDSSTAEEIRAGNAVAEKYPDAKEVRLEDDMIAVDKGNGTTAYLKTARVLRRELGEDQNNGTSTAPIPSMEAAAEHEK